MLSCGAVYCVVIEKVTLTFESGVVEILKCNYSNQAIELWETKFSLIHVDLVLVNHLKWK